MHKLLIFSLLITLFGSCAPSFMAKHDSFQIKSAELTSGGKTLNLVNDLGVNEYSDSLINVKFMAHQNGLAINITNKYNGQLKINWNESSLKSYRSKTDGKVSHFGLNLIQSTEILPPSVLTKNDQLCDLIVPSEFINYKPSDKYNSGHWKIDDFVNITGNTETIKNGIKSINNSKIRLGLQIEADNKVNNYFFSFDYGNKASIGSFNVEDSKYCFHNDFKVNKSKGSSKGGAGAVLASIGLSLLIIALL